MIYVVQTIWNYSLKIEKCHWEVHDRWKHYITSEFAYIFELIPYSIPLAVLIFVSIEGSYRKKKQFV